MNREAVPHPSSQRRERHAGPASLIITSPPPPSPPPTSTATVSAHATLLLLHDSDLLRAEAFGVHATSKALSTTTRPGRRLELPLPLLSSKPTLAAKSRPSRRLRRVPSTSPARTAGHAAHHRHELVHVHLAGVHALRHHHLHHLVHVRHPGRRGAGHPRHPAAAEHGFHLHVFFLLLRDRARHALLPHAVLRPRVLVEAVVEEVRLVGAGQAPEFRVVGQVGVDVEQGYGFVSPGPGRVGFEVDGACADLREVFAFFAAVGGCASEGGRCCCAGRMFGFGDLRGW